MPRDLDQAFAGMRADCAEVPLTDPGRLRRVGSRRRAARLGLTVGGAAAVVAAVAVASGALPSPWTAPPADSPTPQPSGSPSPATTPVGILPWLADRADWPTPTMPDEHPPAAACPAGALDPRPLITTGAGMGTAETAIELVNVGEGPCSLAGFPTLWHTDGGRTATVPVARAPEPGTPVTLLPGEAAKFSLRYTNGPGGYPPGAPECQHPVAYHDLELAVADDQRFDLGSTLLTIECGGISAYPWARAPLPTRLIGLVGSVQAPATVRAGDALEYVVTLTNPTDRSIGLDPCPVYQQVFREETLHRLNCAVTVIPAGGQLRYAMRTNVPSGTAAGPVQLVWTLLGRDAYIVTTVIASVRVTPA